jgi:hypothetical protein
MQIKRCYPLHIRISAWGAWDSLDFNNETFDEAMKEAHRYYCATMAIDGTTVPAHVQVRYGGEHNGTYRINADGSYHKISDEFLTLEDICALSRKNTVHKSEEYTRCV